MQQTNWQMPPIQPIFKTVVPILAFLFVGFIAGCNKPADDPTPPEEEPVNLVSATASGSLSTNTFRALVNFSGYTSFLPYIKYDVDFFKIVYTTPFKGKSIQASGLLCVPKNTPATPSLVSAQHGTMFLDADAPSNFPATTTGFELLASAGFVTLIPDYIGYGVSKDTIHPYHDKTHSASAVVDMIKASKTFLENRNQPITNRLFLLGYSEGGYATMAAQQELETNPITGLKLTASAAGAGGYDLQNLLTGIAATPRYNHPSFIAFIIHAYNAMYNFNRPYSHYFKEPYASKFPGLLDGTKDMLQVDAALSTSPSAWLSTTFYASITQPAGEPAFKQALTNNSFLNWKPLSPTRLYHGTADEIVKFSASQLTYDRFIAAGATNVSLHPIANGTHETSVEPMMLGVLDWFMGLDK